MVIVNNRGDFLRGLTKHLPSNSIGAEIGVLYGDFSQQILDTICPKQLFLIDPYETGGKAYGSGLNTAYSTDKDYQNLLERFHDHRILGQVKVIRKFSHDAASLFLSGTFAFIYLDASHLYADVKQDLNDWLPKLKAGGIMAGHDHIELADFGVMQAVDEFKHEHGLEMFLFNENGGDWALRRKRA